MDRQEPIRINQGTEQCLSFPLPRLRQSKEIRLSWSARIEGDPRRGGLRILRVEVNGRPVGAEHNGRNPRMINKPVVYTDPSGGCHAWYTEDNNAWLAPLARDFTLEDLGGMFGGADKEVFSYNVDISDLILRRAVNRIVFRHVGLESLRQDMWNESEKCTDDLVLQDVRLELKNPDSGTGSEKVQDMERIRISAKETI